MTEKIRIYDIAKKLKLPNKVIIDLLDEKLNIKVKSHASTISQAESDKLMGLMGKSYDEKTKAKPAESDKPQPTEKKEEPVQAQEFKKSPETPKYPQKQDRPVIEHRKQQAYDHREAKDRRPFPDRNKEKPSSEYNNTQQDKKTDKRQGGYRPEGKSGNRQQQGGYRPDRRPDNKQQGGHSPEGRPNNRHQGGYRPDRRPDNKQQGGHNPEGRPDNRYQGGYRPDGSPGNRQQGGYRPDGRSGNRQQGGYRPGTDNRTDGRNPNVKKVIDQNLKLAKQGMPTKTDKGQHRFPPRADNKVDVVRKVEGGRPDNKFQKTDRPFNKKPMPGAQQQTPDVAKTAPVKKDFGRKKDKYKGKPDTLTKEEKLERTKALQEKIKKKKKSAKDELEAQKVTELFVDKPMTVGELAEKLNMSVAEVVKQVMLSGVLATVNQVIDISTIKAVSEKLEFTVIDKQREESTVEGTEQEIKEEVKIDETKLLPRAPVVTIMGHVDHGKTTLLDAIRASKHKIVSTEVGGITQSIGAYTVDIDEKKIVFIDTPGHEAFTAMRARGARVTDIAILVVAADDGIMPQTIEAINHAKAAKVPIIIAVNKIDKPEADPDRVLQQLTEYSLVPEKWGGDTICVMVSALQGTNLDELLEYILLVAEMEELKADPTTSATGVIIEAKLDKGKGAVASLLVQSGTLKIGDHIIAGSIGGKVRALISDTGERIEKAGPSTPVEILGFSEVPQSGDKFESFKTDKESKILLDQRKEQERSSRLESMAPVQVKKETIKDDELEQKELNIIIKSNTHGSAEAVSGALNQLKSKQVLVNIIHIGIGDISEADVMLAAASNATIIGFSVKEDQNAVRIATEKDVLIRKYGIIYQILEDIEKTMLGLLKPEMKEVEIGKAEVRQIFTIGKTVKIAGCYVLEGKIIRNKTASVIRNGKELYKGTISQLKRFKDDVKEVAQGYECGISFSKFNDFEEGDIINVMSMEEIERETLV